MPILRVVPRGSTPLRNTQLREGRVRKALKLDGATGYASITNANQKGLNFGVSDFLINVLTRPENARTVYRKAGATNHMVRLDSIYFRHYILDGTNGSDLKPQQVYLRGSWHHGFFSVDRDNTAGHRLYTDGLFRGSSNPASVGNLDNTASFFVGTYVSEYLQGDLGRLLFFNLGYQGLTTLKTLHGFSSENDFCADFADRLYKWPYASLADISRPELEMVRAFNVELLSNTGFETAGAGGADVFGSWTEVASDGAIADETTLVYAGSHAAKLTAGASVDTRVYQDITVTPGKMYELSFYDRGDGTYGGRYRVVDVTNANDIISLTATGHTGTTYTKLAATFIAPAGCTTVRIGLWCPSTNTGICYFDTVSVHPVGCVADWRWDHPAGIWNDYTVNANHLTPQGLGREIVNFVEPRSGKQLSVGRNRLITPIKGFPPT